MDSLALVLWIMVAMTMVGWSENAVCSVGCPPDHYEAKPCTNFGDRICKPCRKCEGSTYEIRPCSITSNRHCIHAAHPLLMEDDENMPTFLEGLKVDSSPNVIIEDLHNTHDLETIFYLADRKQASDFKWYRDSGLVVNIGILNVHLIPEYMDVTHESDNQYMLNDPNDSQDKQKFQTIVQKYCRNPMPDLYSITLEITRDRTTKAAMETCDSRNPALSECPPGQIDGDTYLHRTLNEPCEKMGTFPEPLQPAANSIVCTDHTALLTEVFNRTYTEERPIRFPISKCKTAQSRCQQCLNQPNCGLMDIFESRCCRLDCYTLHFCKMAMSPECTQSPVECAMGDAYRYTIQPVFQKIKSEFRCHIKHNPSDILYQLFFNIEMPGTNWATKQVYRTVYAKDLEYKSHGQTQTDYLTIEHNTGIELQEEFILVGTDNDKATSPSDKIIYNITKLKTKDDFKRKNKRAVLHSIDHNIYVASTEFTRPFDYSTTSWVKNNECHKDVSKFNFHDPEDNEKQPDPEVKVKIKSNQDNQPFQYWIQGTNDKGDANAPFIRFTVPGNTSILPWYFQQGSSQETQLLIDDYFQASLELSPGDKLWNIHIQGRLNNCPGYLGIRINDREELEELVRHDLLILCPSTFNLTFYFPNPGKKLDKTFDIHLEDSVKVYHTFLTQLKVGPEYDVSEPEPVVLLEATEVSYTVFLVIAGVTVLAVLVLNKVYLYTEIKKAKKKVFHGSVKRPCDNTGHVDTMPSDQDEISAACGKNMKKGQLVFLVIYVVLRVIYSLLFTFTVFFAILMIFIRSDLNNLSKIDDFVQTAKNHSEKMSHDIDRHWRVELLRQAEKVTDMQGACSNYVTELFDSMAFQMNNITSNYYNHELYGSKTSLSYLMSQRMNHYLDVLRKDISNYTQIHRNLIDTTIAPSMNKYNKFLNVIHQNDWLSFVLWMFNKTQSYRSALKRKVSRNNNSHILEGIQAEFLEFLEVEDVESVRMWTMRYWQKFDQSLPDLPGLPVPKVNPLSCHPQGDHSYNITRQPSLTHMDTVRFYAPHLPADVDKGPVYHHGDIKQEYKFVTEPSTDPRKSKEPLATEELEITNMVNTEVLSIIFLVLDAILLLYRFSHTYLSAATIVKGFNEEIDKRQIDEQEYYMRPVLLPAVTHTSTPVMSKYKQTHDYSHVPLGQPTVDNTYQYDYHGNGPSYHGNGMGTKPNSSGNNTNASGDGIYYISGGRTDFCKILLDTLAKIVLSCSLAKVLIGCIVLVLVYGVMRIVSVVAEMKFILDTNALGIYTSGMDVQINQTNWYLADQAQYFNGVSMNIYQGQMTAELKYLQSMLQYFDHEQKRLVENYRSEGCVISQQGTRLSNWTCDIHTQPPTLNIPLLPCNFVPILPTMFSVLAPVELEQQLVKTLEIYIISSRHVTMVITYILFIAMAAMLTVHVVGTVVFHFVKSSNRFTARRVFVTCYLPPGGATVDDLPPPPTEESDYDSDDNNQISGTNAVWSHTIPKHRSCDPRYTRTYPSPARGRPNPDPTGTLLNDFKYSETKV